MTARLPTLAAIRRTCGTDDADGLIRLLFVRDQGRIGLVQTARETADDADQFLARYLAEMITDVSAPAVLVTVWRRDGKPAGADRLLWRLLSERLAPSATALLDVVTIGPDDAWSARRGRALRRAGRRSASRAAAR